MHEIMKQNSVTSLTFLSSRASFLLATVSLGEKDWRASQVMFGDILIVVFVTEEYPKQISRKMCL